MEQVLGQSSREAYKEARQEQAWETDQAYFADYEERLASAVAAGRALPTLADYEQMHSRYRSGSEAVEAFCREYERLESAWSDAYHEQSWQQFGHGPRIRLGYDPAPVTLKPDAVPSLAIDKVPEQVDGHLEAQPARSLEQESLYPESSLRGELSDQELLDLMANPETQIHYEDPRNRKMTEALMPGWIEVLKESAEQHADQNAPEPRRPVTPERSLKDAGQLPTDSGWGPPQLTLGRAVWYARSFRDNVRQLFRKKEEDQ